MNKVLFVDDEQDNLKAFERTFRGKYEMTLCNSPKDALKAIETTEFASIVSDQKMPEMLGTELLAKASQIKPMTTRVIVTAYTESKEILDAINRAEIYRYVTKPWDPKEMEGVLAQAVERYRLVKQVQDKEQALLKLNRELEMQVERRTAELKAANEKLSELAMTDSLTKVLNRRGLFAKLADEVARSQRYQHPISVAMIDVDHFKQFNDMEGHRFGDEALRKIAQVLQINLRKTDTLGRYGGEEFVAIMPETQIFKAKDICQRLRTQIEGIMFQGQNAGAYLTISIGVAAFPTHGSDPNLLIEKADQALYEAKESGRNRVVLA